MTNDQDRMKHRMGKTSNIQHRTPNIESGRERLRRALARPERVRKSDEGLRQSLRYSKIILVPEFPN
jgi:hypothetical protein